MCITVQKSDMSSTTAGILVNQKTKTHTLLYANNVKNLSNGPNCLILPILGEIISGGLVDTSLYGEFLGHIVKQLTETRGGSRSFTKGVTLHKVGKYDILVANSADTEDVMTALSLVEERKRPHISHELLAWYKDFYHNPQLLLCCFDNAEQEKVQPIMIEFIPRDFTKIVLPGADSHDGTVPSMGLPVDRDHTLVLGVVNNENKFYMHHKVNFPLPVPECIANATWQVVEVAHEEKNADWSFTYSKKFGFGNIYYITMKEDIPGYVPMNV